MPTIGASRRRIEAETIGRLNSIATARNHRWFSTVVESIIAIDHADT
jgi:hypothetical protein